MKKLAVFLTVLMVISFQACKKNTEEEPYLGKNYFPVNTGHELVYEVEHHIKSSFTGLWDSSSYQIKEIIAGTFLDNEGRETQRIERYIKNDSTPGWVIYKVWASNLLGSGGQRVEDNVRYVKLFFPMSANVSWDGNAQNTLGLRNYRYTSLHQPFTLGSQYFDSTCTVLQYADSNLIESAFYEERYATNIGMISRENRDFTYNYCGDPSCDSIISADVYRETLVSFVK